MKRDSIFDKVGQAFVVVGLAAPQFWVAIMFIIIFGAQLGWLPTFGRGDVDGWIPKLSEIPDMIHHLILPAFVLAITVIAAVMRLTRSAMVYQLCL